VEGEELRAGGGVRAYGADGSGDGVGDVVELEVEEDGEAAMAEFLDDGVAFGEVEFEADFEPGAGVFELFHEREGWRGAGVVEGDDKAGGHRVQVTGYGLRVTGYRLQVTGWRVQGGGYRVEGTGGWLLVACCWELGEVKGEGSEAALE
jgi:hypothetical protein